jgi:Nicotinate phosphoribosyltransferase C-terminal domain
VMRGGRLARPHPPLAELRARCAAGLATLPEGQRRLRDAEPYRVTPSAALGERQRVAVRETKGGSGVR